MSQNELQLLTLLLGQIMPPLIDTVNKFIPTDKVRFLISLELSALIAVCMNFANIRSGDTTQILQTALLLWGSAQTAYNLYYKNSQVQLKIRSPY